ncbi:hypothetical protein CANDROIZ_50001 [Candidatus Roizmanbacteria bacterium]|nr:hypothetical protein CANDROIZ_50001 [Candidatus Roizmanbacteria bacterium]
MLVTIMVEKLVPNLGQGKLTAYFIPIIAQLVPDMNHQILEHGVSCRFFSRLIVTQYGGPTNARIWWVKKDLHSYVIVNGQSKSDLAYNNYMKNKRTVQFVKENGQDVTEHDFSVDWNQLI